VNFKIIPTDKIIDKIFMLSNKIDDNLEEKNDIFKESNMLKNMGIFIIFTALFLVLILFVVALKIISKRVPII
jgi:hypothetical protein